MKIILVCLIIAGVFLSCTKDETIGQPICAKVWEIKETYAMFANGFIKADTIWPQKINGIRQSPVCCDSLLKFWQARPEKWVSVCDEEGNRYWERFVVVIKK